MWEQTPNQTLTIEPAEQLSSSLAQAILNTQNWLLKRQQENGYWCAELEGDTILESEYILLLAWLGKHDSREARRAAKYILAQQQPQGGWGQYPGSPLDVSISVKAYFALKLTGCDAQSPEMQRACRAIREAGGADAVNSFTRFFLALLGQIDFDHCPGVAPEMVLLPRWSPISLGRMSAWSRTIFVPLSIVWAHRPAKKVPAELGIEELFIRPAKHWPKIQAPGERGRGARWWEWAFRQVDRSVRFCERWKIRPLRRRALAKAKQWMLDRFEQSDGLGAIFPPIVWSRIALACLGYADDSPEVVECMNQLSALAIDEGKDEEQNRRLQPCKSPVWDTALTLRALSAAGIHGSEPAIGEAIDWLLSKEVAKAGDWSENVKGEPSGWYFEHNNEFYPDNDDTSMVLMALFDFFGFAIEAEDDADISAESFRAKSKFAAISYLWRAEKVAAAYERGFDWLLAMQNSDGGWGAFDKNNNFQPLCYVPFADHNAMIDPSTPDLTGRVLESLGQSGRKIGHPAVDRAVEYLRREQQENGSWFGRWGVNYIYGTWQVLVGLRAVGLSPHDEAMLRGADWLENCQQHCGAWGETPESYDNPALAGSGPATASQTAWALLGLMAAGRTEIAAVRRGIDWLIQQQQEDGSWTEAEFTGTGFPSVFYLRYHYYCVYFPLLALANYRRNREETQRTEPVSSLIQEA